MWLNAVVINAVAVVRTAAVAATHAAVVGWRSLLVVEPPTWHDKFVARAEIHLHEFSNREKLKLQYI